MKVIACVNQKGGVGKTTICANLAYALSKQGQRVVAIDLDPQGHLAQSLGFYDHSHVGIDQVFLGKNGIEQVLLQLEPGLKLISAGPGLKNLESTAMGKGKGMILKKALRGKLPDTDIVLLDCPPSSGFLVVNALAASDELLVPVTPDYLGMSGVSHLMGTIKNFERVLGRYSKKWIVVSREQKRKLTTEVKAKLQHYFKDNLLSVAVTEKAALAESPSHGMPVMKYAPRSASSREFKQMAQAIIGENTYE